MASEKRKIRTVSPREDVWRVVQKRRKPALAPAGDGPKVRVWVASSRDGPLQKTPCFSISCIHNSSRACLGRVRSILYATGSSKAVFSTISFASLLLKSSTATGRVVLFSGSSPHYKKIHLSFVSAFPMFVPSLSW